ncbi:MAG TPA: SpoIIE family protein phosphatase [Pyrinomonadaceae bacterium]|nr:SpoIIE family protein phosphatase [Pyrinomonadaceae bacterium]
MNTEVAQIPRTLIADDQPDVLAALRLLLKGAGFHTEAADSPAAVLNAIRQEKYDLLLMDLNYARDTTSGREGLELISRVHALDRELPIVVMTAWASVDLAVESMRLGVRDFVQKPWENSRLLRKLKTQIQHGRESRQQRDRELEARIRERQLKSEFDEAREIQRGLMPLSMPQLHGFSLASAWQPAHEVSGDYLAAFKLNESQAALCVADVAGKGFPAALLMSNMQAALKSQASENTSPGELCVKLNGIMCGNTPLRKFISCFYGELDISRRQLTYTNAGHNPPILMRSNGECIRLEEGGCVVGVFADSIYSEQEIQFYAGDKLLLFTDGVTEARDELGEEFGEQRLQDCLRSYRGHNAAELRTSILNEVKQFCSDNFDDDAALMVVIAD